MRFDIQLESPLESIWRSIGLTPSEIESNYDDLRQRVAALVNNFLREHSAIQANLLSEAQAAEEAIRIHLQRFRLAEPEGLDPSAPLRVRIQTAKSIFEELADQTVEQEQEFQAAFEALSECFDVLEIEDRGEYAELGEDFGIDKLDRMSELITSLKSDIASRVPRMNDLCAEVERLTKLLDLPAFEKPNTLGDETFERIAAERDELDAKLQANKKECLAKIDAIRWLEFAMKSRTVTSENFKTYGDKQVEKLRARLAQLEKEKEEHLPDFIEAMKKELLGLWGELHIPVPGVTEFPFVYNSPANKRTLVAIEAEVLRLANLKEHIAPMLDQIAVRESIIADYEGLQASSADPGRLTSRRGKSSGVVIEEERIRKRYTVELPRVNAKLIALLRDYEDTFGEKFLWDGEVLIDIVEESQRKNEASAVHTKLKTQSQRVSPARQSSRSPGGLSQRAPFQLQEFLM